MSIKKCQRCGRYDFTFNMSHDSNYHYFHLGCERVMWSNRVKLNNGKEPANRGSKTGIFICPLCGMYDLPENMYFTTKVNKKGKTTKILKGHKECLRIEATNRDKLQPMKEGITHCQITGIEFGMGQAKATADHDHDTLLGRAVICNALNHLEGQAKFIMEQTGCDTQGIKEYLDALLAMPGIDLGLEPYPELGYATYEEAASALNEIKAALNETTN